MRFQEVNRVQLPSWKPKKLEKPRAKGCSRFAFRRDVAVARGESMFGRRVKMRYEISRSTKSTSDTI
jgi:hypothetical protein